VGGDTETDCTDTTCHTSSNATWIREQAHERLASATEAVYRHIYIKTQDHHLAWDIAQEATANFLENIDSFDRTRLLEPYICTIADHLLIDHWRKEGRKGVVGLTDDLPTQSEFDHGLLLTYIKDKAGLSIYQYQIVELRLTKELEPHDIAIILNDDPQRVRRELHRALAKIRNLLNNGDWP
jgi:RNA polymerase sigma factor (sigma-70 family)